MTEEKLIYSGKAKDLYQTDDDKYLRVFYKDQATAGNGAKKENLPGKGRINQAITQLIFTYLADHGIATHLVKVLNEREEIIEKAEMFPLEVVYRNYAAGSFVKRLGIERGLAIEGGILEFFYKDDDLNDPLLNDDHVLFLKAANPEEIAAIKALTKEINDLLVKLFDQAGLILVDFKLEFGKNADGEIILADEISPDNARLWDKESGESFDKDIFRNDQGDMIPYYQAVYQRLQEVIKD
ncbi:phosphoribosylaminoimidazolesuccinocarboxamide synthase [Aerococcus loyolae]|uniref:phosphoribosylaminoimidazolesuccinocarboxamide synthase n=1 Tax=Aerococcus loyolae TaxID=2976809 RepID=UPI000C7902B2|nr:phosphoribosylaminoimidazolesuccinocarboxamide synthase [Aerococcus loyolae]PKY86855.1 phosphoribosylaminoimidazolesuccinocarboxamide synthase [Aerococcus loyolae]PKZ04080.1 phosphoribosylaminoimidazolesuccinocarboxamide synthase [Aerococcus loyolae]WIK91780.1 phosphoribosylaminoimidazolesuccinocarboxamide synthase [Aerococcus loyolae]